MSEVVAMRRAMASVADLNKALQAYGVEMATKIGVKANARAAKVGRDALVEAAPYDPATKLRRGKDLGHIRTNIRVRRAKARKQYYIIHNIATGRAFWANFVEFGTAKLAPHTWYRPTILRIGPVMIDAQISELRAGSDAAAHKSARLGRKTG